MGQWVLWTNTSLRLRAVGKRGVKEPFQKLAGGWVIYLLHKYSLSSHRVPGTVLGTKYTLIGKTEIAHRA